MSKKMAVMSLAIEPKLQDDLKNYAKKRGQSASSFVRDVVIKHLVDDGVKTLVVQVPDDDSIIPIVLKVPVELKGNREGLESWLNTQKNGILNKLAEVE